MNVLSDIRVGIVTQNHFPRLGGMEFCTHYLASALESNAHTEVTVACDTMPEVPKNFPYPYRVYRSKSLSVFTKYLILHNLEKMIRKEGINVLHGMMFHGGGYYATKLAQKNNLPLVVHSHGSDVQIVPEVSYGARFDSQVEARIRLTLDAANRVVAVSELNKSMILELGIDPEKISVVYNVSPIDEILRIPYENVRAKYGLNQEDFVIITVGRNSPVKRMALLFKAMALIKNNQPKIKCISVGPPDNLKALAKEYGLDGQIVFTGAIPSSFHSVTIFPPYSDLINLYRSVDLYVSVSYVEAFSMSALDALVCGTPILTGKKHGIREVMIEGESGFTLERETPEDLAELLVSISKNRRLFNGKRPKISKSVGHLNLDFYTKQMFGIYDSVI